MAIHYVTIKGRIKNGKLELDVPPEIRIYCSLQKSM
jgi:hypothetical protein